jgi:hypothetical protein
MARRASLFPSDEEALRMWKRTALPWIKERYPDRTVELLLIQMAADQDEFLRIIRQLGRHAVDDFMLQLVLGR